MFKYRATESMVSKPGEVEDKRWEKDVSAGAVMMVGEDVIHGIITSVVEILVARGKSAEEINSKTKEFINAMRANNDITADAYDWLKDSDNVTNLHHWYDFDQMADKNNSEAQLDVKYDPWWTLRDTVTRGCRSVLSWEVDRKKFTLNEREKAMLDELDELQEKYYNARRTVREYFEDMAVDMLHSIIIKYSDVLSKIDEEWFSNISKGSNRDWDNLQKKIAAKKAEEDSALSRSLPASATK